MISVKRSWMWITLPVNMALAPISTLVTLDILSLGGNAIDVGNVITLGNLILIPASYIWGKAADRFNRKLLVVVSFGTTSLGLLLFPLFKSIPEISILYSFVVFCNVGYNTPINLLLMESVPKKDWATEFSTLSMLSSIGGVVGYVFSSVITPIFHIFEVIEVLGFIEVISFLASLKLVPNTHSIIERTAMVHHKDSFITRLKMHPLIFLHFPNLNHFKLFSLSRLRNGLINYVPLLYLAIFIFYISSGLFNTQFPVALYRSGISELDVMVVITVGMIVQTISFMKAGDVVKKIGEHLSSYLSLILRGITYIGIGITSAFLVGAYLIGISLVMYPLAAGVAYAIYYISSTTLVFKVVGERRQGTGLGVYSTMVGIAQLMGSLLSGYISHYIGFDVDFGLAGALLLISSYIFKSLNKNGSL
ncbi:MFS transporter [Sulfolobales archaeon HS-7]|nr:MFS transporter [Sulfolobales archaeon HS-7]